MKAVKIILALLFAAFAVVQYNDPDPWLWITIYGVVAILFVANLVGFYNKPLLIFLMVAGILYSITYFSGVREYFEIGDPGKIVEQMKATEPFIEETREFGGLWICIFALFFLYKKG